MSRRRASAFRLTSELVAAHAGAPIVCLDVNAVGRTYPIRATRPGAETIRRVRADGSDPYGGLLDAPTETIAASTPTLCVVEVRGVLEQRAGYHDVCGGWTDGHDAVAERMCAALAEGNVLLVIDSPGGACAGLQEAVSSVLRAKAEHGRHVIAWADEQIGSAAAWWALSVADELFVPGAGAVGSIGARWAHTDISEALKKEGLKVSHICWPNSGKVALAPDAPLSDVGRARAQRDIDDAGEAFAAAVLTGPVARRTGLTYEAIRELGADMLTGRRAVAAGLADGVARFDEVMVYALALASGEGDAKMATEYEKTTREKMTDDGDGPPANPPESEEDEKDDEEAEDDAPPADAEGDDEEKEAEDDAPPSSEKPGAAAARARVPKAMTQTSSIAEILGASSDSMPAVKTAGIALRQIRDLGARLTGQRSSKAIMGGLVALAEDAAALGAVREELRQVKREAIARERMDLLGKLAAAGLPGYSRGELFVDRVTKSGKRIGVKPSAVYAEMSIGTLRGLVASKLANASGGKRPTPFEPSRERAKSAAGGIDLKALEKHPAVVAGASRSGAQSIDKLAASYAANFPDNAAAFCRQHGDAR